MSTLEVGHLAVCSFGEETELLHDFQETLNDESGAHVLRQCTFKQQQTRIAKVGTKCLINSPQ